MGTISTSGKVMIAVAAVGVYFITAYWLEATFVPDPNGPPPSAGIRVRLIPPLASYNEFSVRVDVRMFADVADIGETDTRSSIELWENNRRLGPAHSTLNEIVSLGNGRFFHQRGPSGTGAVVFSSSDNTDPKTNGRTYWVVKPQRR